MDKFTKKKDELLIDLVRCNTVLYDASDKQFKNNIYKHKLWENISDALDIPVPEVKKRWKHLRDHYHKKRKAEKGQSKSFNNWEYMPLLTFLSKTRSHRSSATNVEANNEAINLGTDETEEILETAQKQVPDTYQYNSDQNTENNIISDDNANNNSSTNIGPSRGRKRKLGNSTKLITLLEQRQDERAALYAKLLHRETTTPIKKFFESMADIVEQFPPHLAAEARLKVCQVVTDIELKMHEHKRNISTSMPSSSEDSNS